MQIEDFEFDRNKVYFLYSTESFACKYVKTVRVAGEIYFVFKNIDAGWGSGKNIYVQPDHVDQLFEFDSVHEYEEHYRRWEEERESRRFTGGD